MMKVFGWASNWDQCFVSPSLLLHCRLGNRKKILMEEGPCMGSEAAMRRDSCIDFGAI